MNTLIEQYLSVSPQFIQKKGHWFTKALVIVAGIAVVVLSGQSGMSDALQVGLLSLGVMIVIVGVIMLCISLSSMGRYYVCADTGSRLRSYNRYIARLDRAACIAAIEANNVQQLQRIKVDNNSVSQVHVVIADDNSVALLQLVDMESCSMQPVTAIWIVPQAEVPLVRQWLKQ
mgnify:CR=1 FL=1